jgi:hypothetical protein
LRGVSLSFLSVVKKVRKTFGGEKTAFFCLYAHTLDLMRAHCKSEGLFSDVFLVKKYYHKYFNIPNTSGIIFGKGGGLNVDQL